MIERERQRYAHEKDANRMVVESIMGIDERGRSDPRFQEAVDKFEHILLARRFWMARVTGREPDKLDAGGSTIEQVAAASARVEQTWDAYLGTLDDARLRNRIDLPAADGKKRSCTLEEALLQVYTHGFYHRGQIASLVRALGAEPAVTDFIFFCRRED